VLDKLKFLPALAVIAFLGLMAGCGMEPVVDPAVPNVGTTVTGTKLGGKDIHTEDSASDPVSDPLEDIGVEFVDPSFGTPAGGDIVFIEGWGFTKKVKVYFGDVEAAEVFYVNSKKLRVTTPAHTLGVVDLSVWWPGGEVETLPSGFSFETDLVVDSVEPAAGPIAGGTPIAVTGSGFTPDSKLVLGHRLAINIEVVDETRIYAVTPPGSEGGPADVFVSNVTGTTTSKDAFTYSVVPQIDHMEPAAGPIQGGEEATLRGKWLSPVTAVLIGDHEAEIIEVLHDRIRLLVPAGEAGYADVVAVGTWGWDALENGYFYFDPASSPSGLVAVIPDRGPEKGGNSVTVFGCDLVADEVDEVEFGGSSAGVDSVFESECSLLLTAPPGTGTVSVTAAGKDADYTLPAAYTYVGKMKVTGVTPNEGPFSGGTKVEIKGEGFTPDVQVLVGPMVAGSVAFVDEFTLEAVTPPGSPGLSDLRVVGSGATATLHGGFLYTVEAPAVYAITPKYGSRAGGTYFEVIGSGFEPDAMVYIGEKPAAKVKPKSYGLLTGYSPRNDMGTYDVIVTMNAGQDLLPGAFSYFDPISHYGGTWGEPVDGAVNVTVIDAATWDPLEDAFAVLGSDPETPYRGFTNDEGQVTLSGPGLTGPVDVHITKKDHDAASVVHFDAENVTVYLIPYHPSSPGDPGDPPPALLPGSLDGRVLGLGKYVVIPPGNCLNKSPGENNLCASCLYDEECPAGRCLELGKSGKFCTFSCGDDGTECPDGYMCAPVSNKGSHCVPAAGRKTAQCQLTRTSIYEQLYDVAEIVNVDSDSMFAIEEARLGEIAIVCLGGWEDLDTGEFHPVTMGVKRHINVAPEQHLADQNVLLNIPLSRALRLRMDDPPEFENYGGVYKISAYLDFGSDGIFKLPQRFEGYSPEDIVLSELPEELSGDIYDAKYIFYAGAYTNSKDNTPYSVVYYRDVGELDEAAVAEFDGSAFAPQTAGPQDTLNATWTTSKGTYMVGDDGLVFLFNGQSYYQLPSVIDENLYDIVGFGDLLFAVGEGGAVVHYDGLAWHLVGRVTDMPLRSVWGSDPDDLHTVGLHRIVSYNEGAWHETKVSFDLWGVSGTSPDEVWAVGRDGVVLYNDGNDWELFESPTSSDLFAVRAFADGRVLAAGRGVAFLYDGAEWVDLGLDVAFRATSISGEGADSFYLAGSAGLVASYDQAEGWTYLAAPGNLQVNAISKTEDGGLYAIGSPALLLTPFIPFPIFTSPEDMGTLLQPALVWHYEGNTSPISVHTIAMTEKYGKSLWRFVIDGAVSEVLLPDFLSMVGVTPLTSAEKRVRIYSAHSPGFKIGNFDYSDLGTLSWRSWAYDMITFDPEPEDLTP